MGTGLRRYDVSYERIVSSQRHPGGGWGPVTGLRGIGAMKVATR